MSYGMRGPPRTMLSTRSTTPTRVISTVSQDGEHPSVALAQSVQALSSELLQVQEEVSRLQRLKATSEPLGRSALGFDDTRRVGLGRR